MKLGAFSLACGFCSGTPPGTYPQHPDRPDGGLPSLSLHPHQNPQGTASLGEMHYSRFISDGEIFARRTIHASRSRAEVSPPSHKISNNSAMGKPRGNSRSRVYQKTQGFLGRGLCGKYCEPFAPGCVQKEFGVGRRVFHTSMPSYRGGAGDARVICPQLCPQVWMARACSACG